MVTLDLDPYASRVLVLSRAATPSSAAAPTPSTADAIDISTGWRVAFGTTGIQTTFDRLRSWTDEERTRYFSGTATYSRQVDVPPTILARGRHVRLHLGEGQAVPPQRLRSGPQPW